LKKVKIFTQRKNVERVVVRQGKHVIEDVSHQQNQQNVGGVLAWIPEKQ